MKMSSLFVCILIFFSAAVAANQTKKLDRLLDQIWQYELSVNPIQASTYGEHRYDDQLEDMSPKGLAAQDKQYKVFLRELDNIDVSGLSRPQQITHLMQRRSLQEHIDQYQFHAHFMPLTSESGFHSGLAFLPKSARFQTLQDYQNYLARLRQFPRYFEQQIYWMKQGMESGLVQPKVVLQGFDESVSSYISKDPKASIFYRPFNDLVSLDLNQEQQQDLLTQAEQVISQYVMPSYQGFYDFLVVDYIPHSKTDIAAKSWPNGEDYYQNRIEYYTTTKMTAVDIHELGLQEVARIRAEMQQVVEQLKFDGTINEFIRFLRSDPRFYAKTADELLKQAAYLAKQIDAKLPQLFYTLPRTPYGVAPVPDNIAPKYTTGRYISPTRDDQPGYYWVNTFALDKRPLYALTALTLHEAVPGHHLQISLAQEMQNLPPLRRYAYISAFGEGWGLYSEFLGKEVAMYATPYDEFGRLSYEMWRACRLVVDTGMHMQGWSRQQAIDYMLENTALSEHNVTTEVDRYISWPAQALSYKIGELIIKKVRQQAEQALGDKFDLRAFHDAVLAHGSVPLSVLEENIQLFISQGIQHKSLH
jgi:uncharacterized protein (DUF885 family)